MRLPVIFSRLAARGNRDRVCPTGAGPATSRTPWQSRDACRNCSASRPAAGSARSRPRSAPSRARRSSPRALCAPRPARSSLMAASSASSPRSLSFSGATCRGAPHPIATPKCARRLPRRGWCSNCSTAATRTRRLSASLSYSRTRCQTKACSSDRFCPIRRAGPWRNSRSRSRVRPACCIAARVVTPMATRCARSCGLRIFSPAEPRSGGSRPVRS